MRPDPAPPLPRRIVVDIMDACNLRCPLCPTGARDKPQNATMMPLAEYVGVIEQLPRLASVSLFNWGEPLLHPELAAFVSETTKRKIGVDIHTHASVVEPDAFFEELVRSCHFRTRITASVDGASQETYEQYRRGGDLERVVCNLQTLARSRDAHQAPIDIVWKMIVNRHNEHEVDAARARAEAIGAKFTWQPMGLGEDLLDWKPEGTLEERKRRWLPVDRGYWNEAMRRGHHDAYLDHFVDEKNLRCRWLWDRMVITPRGSVLPCCLIASDAHGFGNAFEEPLAAIWGNARYTHARSLFGSSSTDGTSTICDRCPVLDKIARLAARLDE